jgi:hypothetical protein
MLDMFYLDQLLQRLLKVELLDRFGGDRILGCPGQYLPSLAAMWGITRHHSNWKEVHWWVQILSPHFLSTRIQQVMFHWDECRTVAVMLLNR